MCDLSIKQTNESSPWILQGNSTYHLRKKLPGLAKWLPDSKNWMILDGKLKEVIQVVKDFAELKCEECDDGQWFWVSGESTYSLRQMLKDKGAKWDKKRKQWKLPIEYLDEIQSLEPELPELDAVVDN